MTERLRVAVLEDEPLARRRLERLVQERPELQLVGSFAHPRLVGEALGEVDLLFLDIEMPFESGFAWLDRQPAQRPRAVVVVTAHERHALPAIRREVVDFLLKPYDDLSFGLALARVQRRLQAALPPPAPCERKLSVQQAGRTRWLDPAALAWLQAAGKQVRLRHAGETLLVSGSLLDFEQRLRGLGFVRVHRGCLVNLAHVGGQRPRAHGDAWLLMQDGSELPLSRRYASGLQQRLL